MHKFHVTIDKIDNAAEKSGKWLNTKLGKIAAGATFGVALIFLGFIVFSSKFIKSLFGVKDQ